MIKAELLATALYGDGRPQDVGTDRALANNFNVYIDRISAHQGPFLWNGVTAGAGAGTQDTYYPAYLGQVFLGMSHNNTTVTRTLTVAPFFRSNSAGNTANVRVTLTDQKPQLRPSVIPSLGLAYANPIFPGSFSQASWTTTSTTWQTGSPATLSIAKNLDFGHTWLLVEVSGCAESYGLARCLEGVRVVA